MTATAQRQTSGSRQAQVHRANAQTAWLDIHELCCELRAASSVAQHTPGYKPKRPMGRVAWALALREMAGILYRRRKLGLSLQWHVDHARRMLNDC